jgi:hypothetical protein
MKNLIFLLIACLIQTDQCAQNDVTIGKYRKFDSKILGGEVTCLEHLPDGY